MVQSKGNYMLQIEAAVRPYGQEAPCTIQDGDEQGVTFRASPALIYRRAVAATESPITFWEDADGVGVVLSVAHCVLLGFLDMTLVEQSGSHHGIVACCVRRWSRNRVPGQLPPPLQAEVDIEACPSVKGQRVKESLHGVQDTLKEWRYRIV